MGKKRKEMTSFESRYMIVHLVLLLKIQTVKWKQGITVVFCTCVELFPNRMKCSLFSGLEIATHWSPMQPKIEHWRLNFQNCSPAGDSRFVRWLKKTTTQLLFLNLYTGLLIFRAVAEPRNSGKAAKSRDIHKNTQNTAKFGRNLIK